MQSHLQLLLDQFAQNPPKAGKAMRDLLETDAMEFAKHALELLKTAPVGPGSNYILTLLLRDPSILQKLDPRFDVDIVRQMTNTATHADQLETATAKRLLDLMSAFSDVSRTLPALAELSKHPSPRIRSKAVLLIGRATANARLAESNLKETDKRVRANAIEALLGNSSSEARSILSAAVSDSNNRVAANAALGLYKLDETYSIAIILDMAENPLPIFRLSAVWTMSETQYPRFLGTLAKLIGDADQRVRQLAFTSVAKIRKSKASLLNGPKLKVFATEIECSLEAQRKLRVSVCSEDGIPVARISGLHFALEENKRLVGKYSVQEVGQTQSLAVGIAIPRGIDQTDEFLQSCEASLKSILPQKRSQDKWGILKYAGGANAGEVQSGKRDSTPVTFSANPQTLAEAVVAAANNDAAALNLTAATQRLFAEISSTEAQRRVLLIDLPAAGSSSLSQADADNLLALAKPGKIQVCSLVAAVVESGVNPHLRRLCEASGGRILRAAGVDEIPRSLEVLICTLASSYEITYVSNATAPTSRVSLQVYSPQGCGEQTCEITGNTPKESSIESPTLLESSAHSLTPDPALCS